MSHFTVTVALPGDVEPGDIEQRLGQVLERYDENRDVPRFVEFTKQQLIDKERKEVQEYRDGRYAEYLADPVAYAADCHNPAHLAYLDGNDKDGGFPAKLTFTDEQLYRDATRWNEPADIGPDGEIYSTYNPDSKWDWWSIGGRWCNMWKLKVPDPQQIPSRGGAFNAPEPPEAGVDVARLGNIEPDCLVPAFAVIDLDGQWHESGEMGWWGMVSHEKDTDIWATQYEAFIHSLPDETWVINVDAHI